MCGNDCEYILICPAANAQFCAVKPAALLPCKYRSVGVTTYPL
nr:MAG TPA: hypothetical protein [Caudoviricetes sp.]